MCEFLPFLFLSHLLGAKIISASVSHKNFISFDRLIRETKPKCRAKDMKSKEME